MYVKKCKKESNQGVLQASIDVVQIPEAKDLMKNHTDKDMFKRDLFQVFKDSSKLESLFIKFIRDTE